MPAADRVKSILADSEALWFWGKPLDGSPSENVLTPSACSFGCNRTQAVCEAGMRVLPKVDLDCFSFAVRPPDLLGAGANRKKLAQVTQFTDLLKRYRVQQTSASWMGDAVN